jgi:hypothetical protein
MTSSAHRRTGARVARVLVATGLVAGAAGFAAAPSFAANTSDMTFDCDGQPIVIRVHESHSSENGGWGVGFVVDGGTGHLIPTSFTMSAYDSTYGDYLFAPDGPAKGGGNANHNQDQISCSQSFTDTLGDLLDQQGPPPFPLPDWAQPGDTVVTTFTVTAVPKG